MQSGGPELWAITELFMGNPQDPGGIVTIFWGVPWLGPIAGWFMMGKKTV